MRANVERKLYGELLEVRLSDISHPYVQVEDGRVYVRMKLSRQGASDLVARLNDALKGGDV